MEGVDTVVVVADCAIDHLAGHPCATRHVGQIACRIDIAPRQTISLAVGVTEVAHIRTNNAHLGVVLGQNEGAPIFDVFIELLGAAIPTGNARIDKVEIAAIGLDSRELGRIVDRVIGIVGVRRRRRPGVREEAQPVDPLGARHK